MSKRIAIYARVSTDKQTNRQTDSRQSTHRASSVLRSTRVQHLSRVRRGADEERVLTKVVKIHLWLLADEFDTETDPGRAVCSRREMGRAAASELSSPTIGKTTFATKQQYKPSCLNAETGRCRTSPSDTYCQIKSQFVKLIFNLRRSKQA